MSFIETIKDGIDNSRRLRAIAWLGVKVLPFIDADKNGKIDEDEISQAISKIIPDQLEKRFGIDKILKAMPHIIRALQALLS